jgi:hypothetical protein
METGFGSGLGLGLVSHELLAGELTLGYGWSHTVRNLSFFLSFSPCFPGTLWMPTVFLFLLLVGQHPVWIPFVFLLSSRDRDLSGTTTAVSPSKKLCSIPALLVFSQPAWRRTMSSRCTECMHLMHLTYLASSRKIEQHRMIFRAHPTLAYMYIYCSCMPECMRMGRILPSP